MKKISLQDVKSGKLINDPVINFMNLKAKSIYERLKPHLKGKKILDVGTGAGAVAAYIDLQGYKITSIDIDDSSYFVDYPTVIYDGTHFPFKDNQFDTTIIIHVLHHCEDRMAVLREAARVSKRVIFIEDTYRNTFEKMMTSLQDMFGNWEFYQHHYSTAEEWRGILKKEGWQVLHEEAYVEFLYYLYLCRYVMFVVEK